MVKCSSDFLYANLTKVLIIILSIVVPWAVVGKDGLPGGHTFALVVVFDVSIICGFLIHAIPLPKLPPLPPLLGMLLAGIALRNIPNVSIAEDIPPMWSSDLRSISLAVILLKAGLELDASALRVMKGICLRLTVIPCLVETLTCCFFGMLILGFTWQWSLLLGFVLSAATPAVIVPSLILLQEQQYGVTKGIPTLVMAACSFDDVIAITGFSVILGVTFTEEHILEVHHLSALNATVPTVSGAVLSTQNSSSLSAGEIALLVVRGPLEMIGGVMAGVAFGCILWFIPRSNHKYVNIIRTVFVCGFGILSVFGSRRAKIPGSGALAAIVTTFVASIKWKDNKVCRFILDNCVMPCLYFKKNKKEPVSMHFGLLWKVAEPLLFGLIGAEISFQHIDPTVLGGGLGLVFVCLFARGIASYVAVSCSNLNAKEKIFVCLAWISKATVQAALGPIALDTARNINAPEGVRVVARQLLAVAVLSIIVTAPVGAAAIALSGPKLLSKPASDEDTRHISGPVTSDIDHLAPQEHQKDSDEISL